MDIVGRKVERQVQFWSILGPFLVLLSIAVLLFKVSVHWYFPVSALIGIPLCVKWKTKGMAVAMCCLLLLSGIGYQSLELEDRYWHVGLALAMAFSFIILTLSLEEVQGVVAKLRLESQSRLDNFVLLDEKLKIVEQDWALEREKSKVDAAALSLEVSKSQDEKLTFHKIAQLSKDELVQVRGQHEQLLQDLFYKKQQIAQLYERLEETELSIQGFVNSDSEQQIVALTDRVATLEREREILKAKVALFQSEGEALQEQKEQLNHELIKCRETKKLNFQDEERYEQERLEQQNAYQTLYDKYSQLEEERNALRLIQTNLQQQCEQMRSQEDQLRQILHQSQQKMHELKMNLVEEEQKHESLQITQNELNEKLFLQESQFAHREEELKRTLQELQICLREQKEQFEKDLTALQHQAIEKTQQIQKSFEQEINNLQKRCQQAQEDFNQAQQTIEFQNHELIQMQKNEKLDKENILVFQQQLQEIKEKYDFKKEEEAQHQQIMEQLICRLEAQQHLASQAALQIKNLEDLNENLEATLQKMEVDFRSAEKQSAHEKLPYVPGNNRQIEAMYLQLKQQFQDKCAVLDATRRELFKANETLLKWQKDFDEEQVFDLSKNEKVLQRTLLQSTSQFEKMQHYYQQEIDELTQIIQQLLKQLSS